MKEIITEEDYKMCLIELEKIFDAKPNTKEGEELDRLAKLIEDWENKNYKLD